MKKSLLLLVWALIAIGCADAPKKFRIGVSQCSEDSWRFKQNNELRLSQYADTRIQLEITSADDNDEYEIPEDDEDEIIEDDADVEVDLEDHEE